MMRYVYRGTEPTYHTRLGLLVPNQEGDGPEEWVTLCIAGGLLDPVDETPVKPVEERD
jgi:hypothetical protein